MLQRFGNSLVLLVIIAISGCSAASDISAPSNGQFQQRIVSTDWTWGQWMFYVNESHTSIEAVPVRTAAKNLNVTKFVEVSPCSNCLQISKPFPQPDGTVKVKVWLRHPFPDNPEFTGFDVRGVVIFPATRHWYAEKLDVLYHQILPWDDYNHEPPKLFFSWPDDGGGALLNVEGYSYYFWPSYELYVKPDYEPEPPEDYDVPIYKYQQGKHATPDFPDSTINPYLQFNDGGERRIFKTSDCIMREYYLRLPPGEFSFGYIVQASWAKPLNQPVTDPATDFPSYANAEDMFIVEFDQFKPMDPFKLGGYLDKMFARTTFKVNTPDQDYWGGEPYLYSPEIRYWQNAPKKWEHVARSGGYTVLEPGVHRKDMYCDLGDNWEHDPFIDGTYPAVLAITSVWFDCQPDMRFKSLVSSPPTFHLVEVELVSTGPD